MGYLTQRVGAGDVLHPSVSSAETLELYLLQAA